MKKLLLVVFFVSYLANSQTIDYKLCNDFLKKHVSPIGVVDYDKVLKNMDQINLISSNFSKISPNKSWTENEVKTFWINVYNINVVKLFAENYPLKSINYIRDPFQMKFISFDGEKISLDHISNEILKPLNDPRVNFVLYTTAISSPVLRNTAYIAETIEDDLNVATNVYINDITKNNITAKKCSLSKIFEWNVTDFMGANTLISFINGFSNTTIAEDAKISFMEYDWNLHK
ncbi:DUF547 domain-containing protein [Flavobacterium ardleyense]|uniref:DUF547 domain-containing protein n=1 Tax=Flavobacterium ardleyense TaxID=2038737 RepID=A0ABW5Z7K8_9FLAO